MLKRDSVKKCNRRNFLQTLLAGVGAAAATLFSPVSNAKKLGIKLDSVPALKKVGGSVIVKLNGKQIMLIRVSDKSIKALSPTCTHQQCFVGYNPGKKRLDCKCHGSSFDLTGKVLFGPAPKSLPSYSASLDGNRIIVTVN